MQTDVVLLPGLHGTTSLFDTFVALAPPWARCRPIGLPDTGDQSFDRLAETVTQRVNTLESFVLFAESFSAPIAARVFHQSGPKIALLVLCNPLVETSLTIAPPLVSTLLRFRRMSAYLIAAVMTGGDLALAKLVVHEVTALPQKTLEQRIALACAANAMDLRRYLIAPLLVITGTTDRLIRASFSQDLVREVPFAISRQVMAPHLAAQTTPAKVWAIISEEFERAA